MKYKFRDNKGNCIEIDGRMTVCELMDCGVCEIRVVAKGTPLLDEWWVNVNEEVNGGTKQSQDNRRTSEG